MAEEFLNIVGSFFIKELTGDRREVRLSGRALPYRPFTLEGGHRQVKTWYPGSPVATQQALGADEADCELRGTWKDRFISDQVELTTPGLGTEQTSAVTVNGAPVRNVVDLTILIDDIRRKGQIVELEWMHTVRRGMLTRFKQSWHTIHDCEWEMEFSWQSQGDEARIRSVAREVDKSEISAQLSAAGASLTDSGNAIAFGTADVDAGFRSEFEDALRAAEDAIIDIEDSVAQFTDGIGAPIDASRRILGILQEATDAAQRTIDVSYSRVAAAVYFATSVDHLIAVGVGRTVAAGTAQLLIATSARDVQHLAAAHGDRLARNIESDIDQVVIARQGDDLRDIARRVWGSVDDWIDILHYNFLRDSRLTAGQIIIVPMRGGPR